MISWIKLDINILDDAKIKIIRSHPNGDSVVLLWIGLLCLAMKSSRPGTIEIADGLPYTLDDLANQFHIEKKTVEMGLALFVKYRMVDVFEGGTIDVINFSKHQKLEGIQRTRDLTRARTAKYRERLRVSDKSVTRHAPVTIRHVTPTDLDLDKDKDKEIPVTTLPVDNSEKSASLKNEELEHPSPAPEEPNDEIKIAMRKIQEKKGSRYAQQCLLFIQRNYRNGNRGAIIHCLNQVVKGMDEIEHPRAYLDAAFKIENGKHNARDHDEAAQEYKKPITKGGMEMLGSIMRGMGKGG